MKKAMPAGRQGFTLIELLVVISIIGVLSALLMANISGIRERTRDGKRKADLKEIKSALRLYHNDFDDYPLADGGAIKGCGTTAVPSTCPWGQEFSKDGNIYMKQLPEDPLSQAVNPYTYVWVDRDNFRIKVALENISDKEAEQSQIRCLGSAETPATAYYYVCAD